MKMKALKPIITYLKEKDAHELAKRAKTEKVSISEFVRQVLIKNNHCGYYNDDRGILRERK